ncbi:MAG: hypothetical protein ACLRUM_07935 [Veillonella parvula]
MPIEHKNTQSSKDIEITSVTVKDGIASVEVNDVSVKAWRRLNHKLQLLLL